MLIISLACSGSSEIRRTRGRFLPDLRYCAKAVIFSFEDLPGCNVRLLNETEMALLQTLYDQDYFYLRYTDNYSQRKEIKCYAGPVDGKTRFINPETYALTMRTDVTCDFIEY